MATPFKAPPIIRRVAARREYVARNGKPVVLTIGVPVPVRGSDWGCAVQITGVRTPAQRPKYIFGVDALQALHLALQYADKLLQPVAERLAWLEQPGELGLPKFIPNVFWSKHESDRFVAHVHREFERRLRALARRKKWALPPRTR